PPAPAPRAGPATRPEDAARRARAPGRGARIRHRRRASARCGRRCRPSARGFRWRRLVPWSKCRRAVGGGCHNRPMDSGWFDATLAWISAHPVAAGGLIFLIAFCDAIVVLGILVPALPLLFAIGALIGLGHIDGPYA